MRTGVLSLSLLTALTAVPARADDPFVDSRLTVTLGDDDLLHDAGEQLPDSPRLGFGDRQGYELFYDNLNTRFSGRESLTHLVFHRKLPSFFDRVTTEAAVVMRAMFFHQGDSLRLEDTGSYVRISYHPFDDPDDGLALTAFPFNADRVRLGFLYDLSVGGDDAFVRSVFVNAPGVKLGLEHGALFCWAAFKAVLSQSAISEAANEQGTKESTSEAETVYAAFGGIGADLSGDRLRLEAAGAYIQQGEMTQLDVAGEPVWLAGGAARAVLHLGMPLEDSIDFALYRNDPNRPFLAFQPVRYSPGETSYLLSAEAVALAQHLADVDSYGGTELQRALAWAVRARVQHGYLRLELAWLGRDVGFLAINSPGYPTWSALPDAATNGAQQILAASGDYCFPELHLTLELSAGLQLPAHVTTQIYAKEAGSNAPPVLIGERTLLFSANGQQMTILPDGDDPRPVLQGRAGLRLDLSEMLHTRLWVQYGYDGNNRHLEVTPSLSSALVTAEPHAFGLGISAALRL